MKIRLTIKRKLAIIGLLKKIGGIKMDNIKDTKKTKEKVNSRKSILDIVYIALFAAIISVCSLISIPIGAVPVTLQILGICLAAGFLGLAKGTTSVVIYILLGLIGIPVFAGGTSGFAKLASPTGGYIVGFIFTAIIIGLAVKLFGRKLWVLIVSMVVGVLVCYAFGTAWFIILYNNSGKSMDLANALSLCVTPFLPFDAVKIVISAVLVNRLHKFIKA